LGNNTAQRVGEHGARLRLTVAGKTSTIRQPFSGALLCMQRSNTEDLFSAAVRASEPSQGHAFLHQYNIGILA